MEVPALRHSHEVSKLALKQARENGISIVFTTAWGDSGAEASIFTILPTLLLYGEAGYTEGDPDQAVSDKLKALTGYTLEEYFTLCEPNVTPTGNKVPHVNPAKYLFFQDPLQGLFDYHVREDFPAFFADCAKKLAELAQRDSKQAYLFDVIGKLCSCLELKSWPGWSRFIRASGNSGIAKAAPAGLTSWTSGSAASASVCFPPKT